RLKAERRLTEGRQVGFLRQVARREELDAGLLEAVLVEGLDEAERRRAGGQEGEDPFSARILDALHDRREVVGLQRHADRLDDLAARRLEAGLEGGFRIDARAVVADKRNDLLRAPVEGDL